jgi:glutamine amidotransferase-like uncharacterized protein
MLLLLLGCSAHSSSPTVALYHDEGVWLDGVIATEHMLDWMGISWREIDAEQLNEQGLDGFEIFWLPGGWAPDYSRKIRESGRRAILELVGGGGVYVGICAGAYYAASTVTWEGENYPYPLGLFRGATVGPEIYPWPLYGIVELELNLEHPINAGGAQEAWVLLYGGGHFEAAEGQEMAVVARYKETKQPAIITFSYGRGRVLLLGVHPEIEEDDARDGTRFAQELDDQGSDWPFMQAALGWVLNGQ